MDLGRILPVSVWYETAPACLPRDAALINLTAGTQTRASQRLHYHRQTHPRSYESIQCT